MAAFDVEFAALCEYVSHDHLGKYLLAGTGGEEISIVGQPRIWPLRHLFIILRPREPSFEFQIQLVGPNGQPVVKARGEYSLDRQPEPIEAVNINLELQQVPFGGFGSYVVEVLEIGGSTIYRKQLNVRSGAPAVRSTPKISVRMEA